MVSIHSETGEAACAHATSGTHGKQPQKEKLDDASMTLENEQQEDKQSEGSEADESEADEAHALDFEGEIERRELEEQR